MSKIKTRSKSIQKKEYCKSVSDRNENILLLEEAINSLHLHF